MKTNNIITARVSCVQKNLYTLLPCAEDGTVCVGGGADGDCCEFFDCHFDSFLFSIFEMQEITSLYPGTATDESAECGRVFA